MFLDPNNRNEGTKKGKKPAQKNGTVPLVIQHCDPPYRAIGYSYWGVWQSMLRWSGGIRGGGVLGGASQVNAALSAIGRYMGV